MHSVALAWIFLAFVLPLAGQWGGELRLSLHHDPKTFDPSLVDESSGEMIRFLTGGVLMRVNRVTQKIEPELARTWKITDAGRNIALRLRTGLTFSDGTPFTAEDVAFTFRRLMDPELRSPTADGFRSGPGAVVVKVLADDSIAITFPAPVAALERLLDQVAVMSSKSPLKERAVLGPFMVSSHRPGNTLELRRNPHYWKKDQNGRRLPYLDGIRFDIQANRDTETLRLRRGEIHMVDGLDAETYERLKTVRTLNTFDAGPTTDSEMMWFNMVDAAPLEAYKKKWFQSRAFRQAISAAINRDDIVRLAYKGYAEPSAGPVPPSSTWFASKLRPQRHDPAGALRILQQSGFRRSGQELLDQEGNRVAFSLITGSGNKVRSRIAAMIQQDLAQIGITVNITALDFPSLIERITRTFRYEACLLGLVNIDPDPNGQMNIWLSSAANHQWNPKQKSPATPWEQEIDRLMRAQAEAGDHKLRKRAFDRVQEIALVEQPFIYLVHRHALAAASASLKNVAPAPFRPHLSWNVEYLSLSDQTQGSPNVRAATSR